MARNEGYPSLGPFAFLADASPSESTDSGTASTEWNYDSDGWDHASGDWQESIARLPTVGEPADETWELSTASPSEAKPASTPSPPSTESTPSAVGMAPMPPLPLGSLHDSKSGHPAMPPMGNPLSTVVPKSETPSRKLLEIPDGYFDSPMPHQDAQWEVVPQPVAPMEVTPLPEVPVPDLPPKEASIDPQPAQPTVAITSPTVVPVSYIAPEEEETKAVVEVPREPQPVVPASISTVRPDVWKLFRGTGQKP